MKELYYKRIGTHEHPKIILDVVTPENALKLIQTRVISYFGKYVLLSKFPSLYTIPNILNGYWCNIYIRENIDNPETKHILPELCVLYINNVRSTYSLLKKHPEFYGFTRASYYIINKIWPFSEGMNKLIKRHGYKFCNHKQICRRIYSDKFFESLDYFHHQYQINLKNNNNNINIMTYYAMTHYPPKHHSVIYDISIVVMLHDVHNGEVRSFEGYYDFNKQRWSSNGASFGYNDVKCWSNIYKHDIKELNKLDFPKLNYGIKPL